MEFEQAIDNRSRCSFCPNRIEKGTYFLSSWYKSAYGTGRKNCCVKCMARGLLKNYPDRKQLNSEVDKLVKEECLKKLK